METGNYDNGLITGKHRKHSTNILRFSALQICSENVISFFIYYAAFGEDSFGIKSVSRSLELFSPLSEHIVRDMFNISLLAVRAHSESY